VAEVTSGPPAAAVSDAAATPARTTWLAPAAWLAFALALLFNLLTLQAPLLHDASAFFVLMLEQQDFVVWPESRMFGLGLMETPLVLALRLGVTNLEFLQLCFGFGILMPWPLALLLCWRLAPGAFWLPVAALGLAHLNSAIPGFSPALVAHALVWPVLVALVFVRPLTCLASVALAACSLLLLYSYESQLFLGPPLAALAFWRLRGPEAGWARLALVVSGLLLLGSAAVAVEGLTLAENSINRERYLAGTLRLLYQPPWTVGFSALLVAVIAALLLRPALATRLQAWPLRSLVAGSLLVWGLWPFLAPGLLRPFDQYHARVLCLAVPLALLPLALLAARHPGWFNARLHILRGGAFCLLLAQSLWHLGTTHQWQGYVGVLRGALADLEGPLRIDDTPLAGPMLGRQSLRFHMPWSLPRLTLLLAPEGQVRGLLYSRADYFHPYDPPLADTLPDLSRYGIDTAPYLAALRRRQP
jgi:hypothetical protein